MGLYYELLDHNAKTADFIHFVQTVHRHLRRSVIFVWDRLPAHRSAARYLLANQADWFHVEWLPPYAPELDPVESVWNQSKYGVMANVIPEDIAALHAELDQVLNSFRHQPKRLHSFFDSAHLEL